MKGLSQSNDSALFPIFRYLCSLIDLLLFSSDRIENRFCLWYNVYVNQLRQGEKA